jgi:hypothetical protein
LIFHTRKDLTSRFLPFDSSIDINIAVQTISPFAGMQEETTVSVIIDIIAVLVACVGIYVTWRVTKGKPTASRHMSTTP